MTPVRDEGLFFGLFSHITFYFTFGYDHYFIIIGLSDS
ncbi:hypothetical protein [Coxiella burnetii]|uniref:Uncharacterized protein n=2 Tax=Coxiella burnetii TaxID=777 RepID=Q83F47_COXBU|nr:hypothetical protein [Coxiella burnetii]NP_819154.2 hypothetical protein CBU_0102 [Coxiella burnetii RSA 493]AAO89668.2 hypothetical protein CBU_0102 [Coxiella burnetii RSA 493]ABS76817.1 hypothetical protein CBUD_2004 [Coxiella burnetii Dugway 5J108-111]ABX78108.1 hypothetical protein COXBURSA331_A0191 [Coxiella burnetii RSA 331]ACJ19157.1 hypothetical protein CbuG_1910 [Coxiella burnetii CbuG_Q212]ACJ21058.1 hypothetical protein CbuK_1949 [Coxiella burnetii CbuK_Q154]